jgi:hypothetical protein
MGKPVVFQDSPPSAVGVAGTGLFPQSFSQYQLVGIGNSAALIGSFWDGTGYRVTGRTYSPYASNGNGWGSTTDLGYAQLDSGVGTFPNVALGVTQTVTGEIGTPTYFGDFWGSTASTLSCSAFTAPTNWTSLSTTPTELPIASGIDGPSVQSKGIAFDSYGNAYLAINQCHDSGCSSYDIVVHQFVPSPLGLPNSAGSWDTQYGYPAYPVTQMSAPATFLQLVGTGLGASLVYFTPQGLYGADSLDETGPFTAPQPVATFAPETTPNPGVTITPVPLTLSAAADASGDVLAVFVYPVTATSIVCDPGTIGLNATYNCQNRVFAAVRGASGIWSAPTQLDDSFDITTTTLYQNAGVIPNPGPTGVGGMPYARPGITYIGNGTFMATFSLIDNLKRTSGVYTRTYQVGVGWNSAVNALDVIPLPTNSDSFRYANQLHIASDQEGDAIITASFVNFVAGTNGTDPTERNYTFKVYRYVYNYGWQTPDVLSTETVLPQCPAPSAIFTYYDCWYQEPQGYIFPSGEAVVVVPALDPSGASQSEMRLFSTAFRLGKPVNDL